MRNYKLKEEFDNLFSKLDAILQEAGGDDSQYLEVPDDELKKIKEKEAVEVDKKYTIVINPEDEITKKYIALYTGKRRDVFKDALERSGLYREMILSVIKEYKLPEELMYLPVVESLYKINAYSRAGAVGLWQIMPRTGRNLGLKINYWIDERRDPEKSTRAALKYLKELHDWFNDWHLALAAYNRGEVGIGKDLEYSKSTEYKELQDANAIPSETNHFVPKFMACAIIGDNYRDYGFNIDFQKPTEYNEVKIDKAIDLEVIAKCVNTGVDEIKRLNPYLTTWCTPKSPEGFLLKLPPGTTTMFRDNIAQVKDLTPSAGFVNYRVKKGDVLDAIARRYRTTAYAIKRENNLSNANVLKIGQKLRIIPGRKYFSDKKQDREDKEDISEKSDSNAVRYKIKKGDGLLSVAKKYGTTVSAIKNANGITNEDRISEGQILVVIPGKK